eukprot:CAMPEP_0118954248 /NCGR_PEP_ID=MMETSP1169-20130426/57915_1 /TAXON_ID=36882 /ORGANISM="Pyramimonas obovata, Strain CCMP722" /LENGTH=113 /DNA_ID=CAMNT_0006901847 /DNA_START=55 /DNA_END=393 /DNA_ORIENTATION=+
MSKRQFPYYTPVNSFEVKRQTVDAQDPRWNTRPTSQYRGQSTTLDEHEDYGYHQDRPSESGTDFTQWSDTEIKQFLDNRGEDFVEGMDRATLMALAQECERSTGPARKPEAPE